MPWRPGYYSAAFLGRFLPLKLGRGWFSIPGRLFAGMAVLILLSGEARAHGFSPAEDAWLNRQHALDGMKCCDATDAHVAPDVEWRHVAGRYEVRIRGAWVPVPPGRIMREVPSDPSPWGQAALLFHSRAGQIWCFRPEPLM